VSLEGCTNSSVDGQALTFAGLPDPEHYHEVLDCYFTGQSDNWPQWASLNASPDYDQPNRSDHCQVVGLIRPPCSPQLFLVRGS